MLRARPEKSRKLDRLERAISRARLAIISERLWPRLVPILSVAGLYVLLSWLGYWRLGGDWLRLGTLGVLGLALLAGLVNLVRIALPGRFDAMRRVELASGLPHRPARGLTDTISEVADDSAARALWAAEQARLYATLAKLKVGAPRPAMAERDPNALRFAVPVLLVVAFGVGWGEWQARLGEAFSPVEVKPLAVAARIDAWVDPPPYTRQAPVYLSRRADAPAATAASVPPPAVTAPTVASSTPDPTKPVSVPEGSKLTVRVVSKDAAEVTLRTGAGATALAPKAESREADSEDVIRSYEAVLDRDATLAVKHADGTTSYALKIVEDRPPTITRGPLTVNQSGSFQLAFNVNDDYGVTEGKVTFRAAEQAEGAHPLVEAPTLAMRIDRSQPQAGGARVDGRLEAHPYAGIAVLADAVVKDAAGQEARPSDSGKMTLPARPFYKPLARALIEQRQILALDANSRPKVTNALDALTIAPDKLGNSGAYLGLRVAYSRLVNARDDNDLRGVLDYLWDMARAIEDGDMSDAEQRLQAAREALEQALKDGASDEEIARLTDELRQAMQEFLQSYMAEMQQRGLQNAPQTGDQQMQELSEQDLQKMLDRIEDLAKLGDRDAAQELLSQLQQMLDNLQMAQPGQQMDPEAMKQMDELAQMMREQQKLMDQTFQLNQGRRPDGKPGQQGDQSGQEPLSPEEFDRLMKQLQEGQGQLAEQLKKLLQEMQGQQGQQGQDQQGQEGQGQGQLGQNGEGQDGQDIGRSLGRAGRAMGDATRSLGQGEAEEAYGHQGEALDALREGMQGMMQQMYSQQPGAQGRQVGGRSTGNRDPLGRPQRTQGPDLGQSVKVPDEIDVERARRILEAIRSKLGERFRSRQELDYLQRLLNME